MHDLSRSLVMQGYRIATGFGLGVGDSVITGAIEQVFRARTGHIEDSLIMRPFPRANPDEIVRKQLWEDYRQDLISTAGIGLFVLGNKKVGEEIVLADGVSREFEIARERGLFVVPLGGSGYMAEQLWNQVMTSFDDYYPGASADLKQKFMRLGNAVDDPAALISGVLDVIATIVKE